jgi:acyl carrier protein phosphodiesterase
MNWLAHSLLSEPTAAFRLGNLLPDLLTHAELREVPADLLPGVRCHRAIDAFTDSHPAVRRSIACIKPPYRRFGGILVDVFYDHILSQEWHRFCPVPLETFVLDVYASISMRHKDLPSHVHAPIELMITENWLCSYRDPEGLRLTAQRIGRRLRRPVDLRVGIEQLEQRRKEVAEHFESFFPELLAHVCEREPRIGAFARKQIERT